MSYVQQKLTSKFLYLLGIGVALAMTSCGSSDSSSTKAPKAKFALSTITTEVDKAIDLDASTSTSTNGDVTKWSWSIKEAPQGSKAKIVAQGQKISFVPDLAGSYEICLKVKDSKKTSTLVCKELTVTNPNPVAVLAEQIGAVPNQKVQLDGSSSQPPTGGDKDALTYKWKIINKPTDSTAELDDDTRERPRFVADKDGTYEVQLIVSYNEKVSKPVVVEIVTSKVNAMPIAKIKQITAGDIKNWELGKKITISGADSTDADGDELQYRWSIDNAGYNPVKNSDLETRDSVETSFTPKYLGTYYITLQVYDGTVTRKVSFDNIIVNKIPSSHTNTAPTAVIGNPKANITELELGVQTILAYRHSHDFETKHSDYLTPQWRLDKSPSGFDKSSNYKVETNGELKLTSTPKGKYTISLRVRDENNTGLYSPWVTKTFTAMVGANRAPRAQAKLTTPGISVGLNKKVTLDGSDSDDLDDDKLSYEWTLIDKPNGSQTTIKDKDKDFAYFVADKPGPYKVSLKVIDSHGVHSETSAELSILAKDENHIPIVRPYSILNFTDDQPFVIVNKTPEIEYFKPQGAPAACFQPNCLTLSSLNSSITFISEAFDPDGDLISHLWTLSKKPEDAKLGLPVSNKSDVFSLCENGKRADIEMSWMMNPSLWHKGIAVYKAYYAQRLKDTEWNCKKEVSIAPVTPGDYELQLLVSDGVDTTLPFSFPFSAVYREKFPTLLLEDNLTSKVETSEQKKAKLGEILKQKTFPHVVTMTNLSPSKFSAWKLKKDATGTDVNDTMMKEFTLTAFDKDYTIMDLNATSQEASNGYKIRFEGIENGTVIKKGQSVTFQLMLRILETPEVGNSGEGLHWGFAIKENPEWIFSFTPYMQ